MKPQHIIEAEYVEGERIERMRAQIRAERRRELYRSDPLWRLSKLKANWEYRMRARMR